jgi:hypothetical protein
MVQFVLLVCHLKFTLIFQRNSFPMWERFLNFKYNIYFLMLYIFLWSLLFKMSLNEIQCTWDGWEVEDVTSKCSCTYKYRCTQIHLYFFRPLLMRLLLIRQVLCTCSFLCLESSSTLPDWLTPVYKCQLLFFPLSDQIFLIKLLPLNKSTCHRYHVKFLWVNG